MIRKTPTTPRKRGTRPKRPSPPGRPLTPLEAAVKAAKSASKASKAPANTTPEEHEEQSAFFALTRAHPDPRLRLLHAIPNGGHRTITAAKKIKREGGEAGVPDVHFPVIGKAGADEKTVIDGLALSLYLEFKRTKGGRLSDAQKEWIALLRSHGNRVEVCLGAEAAWLVLCDYLGLGPGQPRFQGKS